ncbi:uncharacterized protein DS421_11g322980 [Arachis hypogaea]|nr:uncharacterized protein DS421_11g322980 [Arachis hypogaea]
MHTTFSFGASWNDPKRESKAQTFPITNHIAKETASFANPQPHPHPQMPSSLNGSPRGLFLATLSSAFVFLLGASPSASLA